MTEDRKRRLTVVTSSELQTWRDCGYKWGLAYHDGLRPAVQHHAHAFGSAIHEGLRAAYEEHDPLRAADAGVAAMRHARNEWYAKLVTDSTSADELTDLAADAEEKEATSVWMLRHYVETFSDDWRWLVPLAIEAPFHLRMQNVMGARVGHLAYAGVWDLVAFDRRHGDIAVFDHKTTISSVDTVDRRVELDPQLAGYVWAVRRALWAADTSLGETKIDITKVPKVIAADPASKVVRYLTEAEAAHIRSGQCATGRVVYNVLRKKRPSEPHVNKDGKVSVAKIDTLPELYERALVLQETERKMPRSPEQGMLLSVLKSKGDTYLSRREFFRSNDEIERWRRELFVDAQRLRSAEEDPNERTRNPGHCTMPWSMPCAYRRPCLDPQMTDGFVVRPRHAEVEDAAHREERSDGPADPF